MKTSKIYLVLVAALVAFSIAFTSCRKKDKNPVEEPDNEQTTATDNNLAETTSSDIESMGSQVGENGTLSTYRSNGSSTGNGIVSIAPCATLSGIGTGTVTVDFGTTGCIGTDGRVRTGKLFFDFSASSPTTSIYYRNPGFSMKVTALNYVVDGYQVTINNKVITNTTPAGAPVGTNLTWSIAANISIVKPNNAGTVSWSCNRTKELINTSDPLCYSGQTNPINWTKAKVKLNGSATGTNAKNENFTATATDLVRDFTCAPDVAHPHRHPFVSGTISYTPGSRPTRLIDFGSGTCDLVGTITINSQTYAFNF
ncbi:MAG: hypothetical protein H0W73_05980 [Bacteroidetes bacterium]|nr:hypothetical protein [Bacteroidota bacterium]